jgi:hypothetical protein
VGASLNAFQHQRLHGDRLINRRGREGGLVASAARRPSVACRTVLVSLLLWSRRVVATLCRRVLQVQVLKVCVLR